MDSYPQTQQYFAAAGKKDNYIIAFVGGGSMYSQAIFLIIPQILICLDNDYKKISSIGNLHVFFLLKKIDKAQYNVSQKR